MYPRYLNLLKGNELAKRAGEGFKMLKSCLLCPRGCKVNRIKGEVGACHTAKIAKVASANLHFGEEPPISGERGSGTIFFSSCNMRCVFCQNYPISQLRNGILSTPREIASMMLSLQKRGCHNINLVTPSHVVPQIIAAIAIAADMGLSVPIVYNSSGYDGIEALRLLDGIVDIYMPDLKYFDEKKAAAYSGVQNYVESAKAAIKEMYRQVGNLKLDKEGIAVSGLLIRHLVLPLDVSDTEKVLKFIAEEISKETFVALMSQYFPAHRASQDPILSRRLKKEEFERAIDVFYKVGLKNGWIQDEDIP